MPLYFIVSVSKMNIALHLFGKQILVLILFDFLSVLIFLTIILFLMIA